MFFKFAFNYNLKFYFITLIFNLTPEYFQTLGKHSKMQRKINFNIYNGASITFESEIAKKKVRLLKKKKNLNTIVHIKGRRMNSKRQCFVVFF